MIVMVLFIISCKSELKRFDFLQLHNFIPVMKKFYILNIYYSHLLYIFVSSLQLIFTIVEMRSVKSSENDYKNFTKQYFYVITLN